MTSHPSFNLVTRNCRNMIGSYTLRHFEAEQPDLRNHISGHFQRTTQQCHSRRTRIAWSGFVANLCWEAENQVFGFESFSNDSAHMLKLRSLGYSRPSQFFPSHRIAWAVLYRERIIILPSFMLRLSAATTGHYIGGGPGDECSSVQQLHSFRHLCKERPPQSFSLLAISAP